MNMLLLNHKVAWSFVTTSGTVKGRGGGRWFKVGFPGLADIVGQLRDGRLFALEVKAPGGKASKEQQDFINLVIRNGGVAAVVESVDMAKEIIG